MLRPAFDVMVCGSLHLDIVVKAPALPRIDETAVGTGWQKICGGKGGNQAVQAARAGARTAMLGRIGRDDFGRTLLDHLRAAGVDATCVEEDDRHGSGMSVAILQDDGDYGAVIVSGANLALAPSSLTAQWTALGGATVLVLQNEIPHAVNVAAAQVARAAGGKVVLNAAPARELGNELLDLADVLVVNRVEAEAMCGHVVTDRASARVAMSALAAQTRFVIMTLGGDGLVFTDEAGAISELSPITVKVTSTHGAGDCFVGVLAAELAKGATLTAACTVANQAAAAFVSRTTQDH